jgi:ABC-type phosphate/phosphonate transport system substrate-binding protein
MYKRILTITAMVFLASVVGGTLELRADSPARLKLVVMDPLSKPLSCDCVKGYAQRRYESLGKYLEKQLNMPVDVIWNASLLEAVKDSGGSAHLVIGKYSVVSFDAKRLKQDLQPVASLTGNKGDITQKGLLVVRANDPAQTIEDLKDYRIFYGPEDAEEKSGAAQRLLKNKGVATIPNAQIFNACSESAIALLKLPDTAKAAAVISSYAAPLLEGCGSVKKGDLRVVGETEEIPFVTAFVAKDLETGLKARLSDALLNVATEVQLKIDLETLDGFIPWEPLPEESKAVFEESPVQIEVKKK